MLTAVFICLLKNEAVNDSSKSAAHNQSHNRIDIEFPYHEKSKSEKKNIRKAQNGDFSYGNTCSGYYAYYGRSDA